MLELVNFSVLFDAHPIVNEVNISLSRGECVVLMGPNGSGKSTLASALMGNPLYTLGEKSRIMLDGEDITKTPVHERAQKGIFLAFQNPVGISGVSLTKLLRETGHFREKGTGYMKHIRAYADTFSFNESLLIRGLNDGFSGGEKKKLEMIQALEMATKYAIFDEIDTGLDIDALKKIAASINILKKKNIGILVITHYQRLVEMLRVDRVIIMGKGRVVRTGGLGLVKEIENDGYDTAGAK